MKTSTFRWATVFIALTALCAFAQGRPKISYVTVAPVEAVKASPGKPASAAIRFRVNDGYHINSSKPNSELLIPTVLELKAPPSLTVQKIDYPAGKDFTLDLSPAEKLSVYSGEVVVGVRLAPARNARPGSYKVSGELKYQACSDNACFPPKSLPVEFEVIVSNK